MFVWCHESVQEFDPGLPKHHSLLPPEGVSTQGRIFAIRRPRRVVVNPFM